MRLLPSSVLLPAPVLLQASLLLMGVLSAAPARALGPLRVDAGGVVRAEDGGALAIQLRVEGGTPPYRGTLFVAPAPQGPFEPLALLALSPSAPGLLEARVPDVLRRSEVFFHAELTDADGTPGALGSALAPERANATAQVVPPPASALPAGPPLPDAPPVPAVPDAPSTTTPTQGPEGAAATDEPPHPAWEPPAPAAAARNNADNAEPRRRRVVRRERVVEVCGVPVAAGGTRGVLMVLGSALAVVAAMSTAAGALLFLIDMSQAQRMVLAVDRSQARGDPRPDRCSSNWGNCRDPYLRAFFGDAAAVGVLGTATLALLVLAAGLFLGATLSRFL